MEILDIGSSRDDFTIQLSDHVRVELDTFG